MDAKDNPSVMGLSSLCDLEAILRGEPVNIAHEVDRQQAFRVR